MHGAQTAACHEADESAPSCDLITLLHHLPPDVVHGSCLVHLGPHARGALRATCRGLRTLLDAVGCLSLTAHMDLPMHMDHASMRAWADLERALPRFQRLQTLTLAITSPVPTWEQCPAPEACAATAAAVARLLSQASKTQLKHLVLHSTCAPLSPALVHGISQAVKPTAGPRLASLSISTDVPHTPARTTNHTAVHTSPRPTPPAPVALALPATQPHAHGTSAAGQLRTEPGGEHGTGAGGSSSGDTLAVAATATGTGAAASTAGVGHPSSSQSASTAAVPLPSTANNREAAKECSEWGQVLAEAVQAVQRLELHVSPECGRLMQVGDVAAFLSAAGLPSTVCPPQLPAHQVILACMARYCMHALHGIGHHVQRTGCSQIRFLAQCSQSNGLIVARCACHTLQRGPQQQFTIWMHGSCCDQND